MVPQHHQHGDRRQHADRGPHQLPERQRLGEAAALLDVEPVDHDQAEAVDRGGDRQQHRVGVVRPPAQRRRCNASGQDGEAGAVAEHAGRQRAVCAMPTSAYAPSAIPIASTSSTSSTLRRVARRAGVDAAPSAQPPAVLRRPARCRSSDGDPRRAGAGGRRSRRTGSPATAAVARRRAGLRSRARPRACGRGLGWRRRRRPARAGSARCPRRRRGRRPRSRAPAGSGSTPAARRPGRRAPPGQAGTG